MFTTFLNKFRGKNYFLQNEQEFAENYQKGCKKTYFLNGHLDSAVLQDKIFKQEVFLKDHLHFLKIKENVDRSGRIAERKGNG